MKQLNEAVHDAECHFTIFCYTEGTTKYMMLSVILLCFVILSDTINYMMLSVILLCFVILRVQQST